MNYLNPCHIHLSPTFKHFVCCCCSVAKQHPTLCDPMDCSTPGFPVLQYLLEFAQTHAHWVSDAIPHLILCRPLVFLPLSFPASGSFPVIRFFASGGQSIGASALVLPKNIQGWFPVGLTGLISLLSKGLSRVLLQHHSSKASVLQCSTFFIVLL